MENPAVTQGSKLLKALGNKKRLEVMYILREGCREYHCQNHQNQEFDSPDIPLMRFPPYIPLQYLFHRSF